MKISSKLNELKPIDLNCNVFDVYSYDGLSMQELLCQFFTKINECIKVSNETIDIASWLVNEGLKIEVVNKLMIWLEDGTLENLINVNLFNTLNTKIDNISTQLAHITQKNKRMMTIIDDTENIQSVIDTAIDKVKFVKGDYNITENIKLKGGIEYDGCGSTLYLNNACIEIENSVNNIVFKNFNIIGDLKHTKITELSHGGTRIKCEKNVFDIGDKLGCSNYGVIDKPYVTITSFSNGFYELDTPISETGDLLNNNWGAVVGTFQWSALINGKHNTNNITIENCSFENARGYAIALPNSDNITIKNTVIKNNGLDFCVFSAEDKDRFNLLIENCIFEQSIDFGKQGVAIPKVPNIYYKNIKILNSTFRRISESAISFGYARGNIQNLIIKGCEFTDNVLFAIHCCGNYLTIKDNVIQGSQSGIRIADITSETYEDDSMYSDIYISNNHITRCKNGINLTQVKKTSGGNFNPKNIEILNNIVSVNYLAVEVCGQNINVVGNRIYSDEGNGAPYFASSLFIHGDNNKCVNVTGNFFDGEINVIWINTFDLKISNNTFNSLLGRKNIRVRPMDSPNKQINMKCVIENNTFYKAKSMLLSTNDGKDYTLFKNNKMINGDSIINIPYMVAKPARYECDGDGLHWISNANNSWMITKDNYFECGGKYGYIASDGTLKVTDDILNIN